MKSSVDASCLSCLRRFLGLTIHKTMATHITWSRTKGHSFTYQKDCFVLAWKLSNSIFEKLEAVKLRTVSRVVSFSLLSTWILGQNSPSPTLHVCSKNFCCTQFRLNLGAHKVGTRYSYTFRHAQEHWQLIFSFIFNRFIFIYIYSLKSSIELWKSSRKLLWIL